MPKAELMEVPISGMDCIECTLHVRKAIAALQGVESVSVYLASEKAAVLAQPDLVSLPAIRKAVEDAGYGVPEENPAKVAPGGRIGRQITGLLAALFAIIAAIAIAGEAFGLFERLNALLPLPVGIALVVIGGAPIFLKVIRAAIRRQVTSHALMSVGAIAALAVGQWVTAAVVVLFMRIGDAVERFTTERARRAVKELAALAPTTVRVEREGVELELPPDRVAVGEAAIVRPGERIPVDGVVVAGHATVDQSSITGESMPVEVAPGSSVFAATILAVGSLRVRIVKIGADTTFGRVIAMVEEAEGNRADVQRVADRFSAYYLPVVLGLAALTFLVSRNPLATAAVLVVACSCSIALATPIAVLASIGAGARRGLLIKGGRYLESLARTDVLLVDKTGTLTLGRPEITDVVALNSLASSEVLSLAASAERYSEHPLAEAVRAAARAKGLVPVVSEGFETLPGRGIRARVGGSAVAVGNRGLLAAATNDARIEGLERLGKTLLFVERDGVPVGVLAASDTLRPEVPAALAEARTLGIKHIELLTGDNDRTASTLAAELGIDYRAGLLPQDKIEIVKEYQARGGRVIMVGDGINDAPALAQADVGIAMGAAGSDIAIEAAHVSLMRDDWRLVPELLRIARRTMSTVRMNLAFTAVYNVVGIALAATGILPPILAAAAQSLPDLGVLANSARLLKPRRPEEER